jgi:acetyl-CoA carboxylase biotin carboxyl carrier protein
MNLDIIAQLVQILRDAPELGAIEVRRGLFGAWSTVRVSKAAHLTNAGGGTHVVLAAPGVAPGSPLPPAAGGAAPGEAGGARREAAPPSHLLDIKSPMVGTFYAAPEPGAGPYVKAGSRVAPGQVVCIIEAMKIMNEIESEIAGVVREVFVENAQPVEFGQPLFRVDPNA